MIKQLWGYIASIAAVLFSALTFANADYVSVIAPQQLMQSSVNAYLIVDVRTPQEFALGHVPNAINIPLAIIQMQPGMLQEHIQEVSNDIVVYCRSGRRAMLALESLHQAGYDSLLHMSGDMLAWEAAELPIQVP